ncbi:MAG: oligosaccharide flippase family protein [Pirellulales bacterium]|nr:oligosaccharide flippase family protein [Pirellulales bacterium]
MEALAEKDLSPPIAAAQPPRSLRGRFYSNAAWSIGGRLLSMGSVFATNVLLARNLSTAEFSAYVVAAAAAMFLAIPAALGAPRVILRLIREGVASNQPGIAVHSAWACLQLVAATCAVLAIMFVAGVHFLDDADKWRAVRDYSLLVAAWFALSASCVAVSHALQGFDDFRTAAMTGAKNGGLLPNAFSIMVLAIAVATGHLTLWLAIAVQVVAQFFALVYACAVLWRITRRRLLSPTPQAEELPPTEIRSLRWFFEESWPILVIQLTSLGVAQVDVLLVSWLSADREIAAYAAVVRLYELLGSAHVLAVAIAAPFISELYVTNQLQKLERMLRAIASMTAIPTLIVSATLLIAPEAALTYTYGPNFAFGADALRIGVIGCSISVLSGTNALVMIMTGQQRQLLRVSVAAGVLYLLVAPAMINAWSITGAAAASSAIYGTYNIIITLMIKARMGIWTIPSFSPADYALAYRQIVR